jgi:hypothetical protein
MAINMKVNVTSFKYLKTIMDNFEKHGNWHLVNDYPTIYLTISFSHANSTRLSMLHVEDSKIEFVHVKHGLTNKLSNIMCMPHQICEKIVLEDISFGCTILYDDVSWINII